jgi:molecular chaperone Hsp33
MSASPSPPNQPTPASDGDQLQPFLFDGMPVRGAVVRLPQAWRALLDVREGVAPYPAPVLRGLGQLVGASALLASTLKFDGAMVLQAQATQAAPVQLMVVECLADLTFRATAKWRDTARFEAIATPAQLLGDGRLTITLDPRQTAQGTESLQQGIVPLEGADFPACLENYMLRSQQLETRLWLAASDQGVGGLMLQRMPAAGGGAHVAQGGGKATSQSGDEIAAYWHHLITLAQTITDAELLSLPANDILHRLFHEENVRVFNPRPMQFRCSCSRAKVANMLRMLGQSEVESILAEQGQVSVNCEFCHARYGFDAIDAASALLGGMTGSAESGGSVAQ